MIKLESKGTKGFFGNRAFCTYVNPKTIVSINVDGLMLTVRTDWSKGYFHFADQKELEMNLRRLGNE